MGGVTAPPCNQFVIGGPVFKQWLGLVWGDVKAWLWSKKWYAVAFGVGAFMTLYLTACSVLIKLGK